MKYVGTVYRPPSEAYSLIIQATIGCNHNRCTFCGSYRDKKFAIRSIEEIREDLAEARHGAWGLCKRCSLPMATRCAFPSDA